MFIYTLNEPDTNEVRYVGITKNPKQRLHRHMMDKRQTHKHSWICSLRRRGLKPEMSIIGEVSDEHWSQAERYWISHYRELGADLTNSAEGGYGNPNPSLETRAKLSAAMKGKPKSPEHLQKLREYRTGRHFPKIAEALKGKIPSEETRRKMSIAHKGKRHFGIIPSQETRRKLSEAHKGKPHSAEHRRKIGESGRATRAIRRVLASNAQLSLPL